METFSRKKQDMGVIAGPAGELEILTTFPGQATLPYVTVICHPHPLYQGTMHNKVVTTLAKSVITQWPTVRFNFRGVQGSAGDYDDGVGEQADLCAVLDWVKSVLPGHQLVLMGFSFGGYVAASVAQARDDISYLCTVAPAIRLGDFNALTGVLCPWLVVYSDDDEIVSVEGLQALVKHPPVESLHSVKLSGGGHFFHGKLIELKRCVMDDIAKFIDGFSLDPE